MRSYISQHNKDNTLPLNEEKNNKSVTKNKEKIQNQF